ncbi:MAG: efflux RND transporter periplasmic adaptor subunit [Pseudomonadota bacterium]
MRGAMLWAGLMTAGIVGWMATGEVIIGGQGERAPPGTDPDAAETQTTQETAPFRVRVELVGAQERIATLRARGRTESADRVDIRAQADGLVEEVAVEKGQAVRTGDLLCRIETGTRAVKVAAADAAVAQAQLDFDAQTRLSERGFAAELTVRAKKAVLDAAISARDLAVLDLRRTQMKAPFDGVVERVPVEVGSQLPIGGHCATVVALDPMTIVSQISERDIGFLELGQKGDAALVTGERVAGPITYIAPAADEETRTFRVEMTVPNSDRSIRDGITTAVSLELDRTQAHLISPAVLTLDDDGTVGVRAVDPDNVVQFLPVTILGDGTDGMWVAGLPETVTIITVGQEYVAAGQTVEPVFEETFNASLQARETETR